MKYSYLEHQFVRYIPETVEPGVLYISLDYATAAHSCCCGCGEEIVTPFTPTDWKMIFDGESITLWPSIGNWNLNCRSHYLIKKGRVVKAGQWTNKQIQIERNRDKAAKAEYYETLENYQTAAVEADSPLQENQGFWRGILNRLFRKCSE